MSDFNHECPQCGAKNQPFNSASTIFCKVCNLTTTRAGRIQLGLTHPTCVERHNAGRKKPWRILPNDNLVDLITLGKSHD